MKVSKEEKKHSLKGNQSKNINGWRYGPYSASIYHFLLYNSSYVNSDGDYHWN